MPFYTGKGVPGEEGFEMKEWGGMYTNPNDESQWSSTPYPGQQTKINIREEYDEYANGRFSLQMVYEQIVAKTCPLSKRLRDFVLSHYDKEGNFIIDEVGDSE